MSILTGTLIKLVHFSHQPGLRNTRLPLKHHNKGYGVIEDAGGGQVYFSPEAVGNEAAGNQFGFDCLHEGQRLDYTMENGPFLRAVSVCEATECTKNQTSSGG